MAFFNEFPHTRTYDGDLGWIIKTIRKLCDQIENVNKIQFSDPIMWDISKQYQPFMVVKDPDTGYLYISKQPVPAGIDLHNEDYWIEIGNFDTTVGFLQEALSANDEGLSAIATQNYNAGDYLWLGDKLYRVTEYIATGDRFEIGSNLESVTLTDEIEKLDTEMQGKSSGLVNFTRRYWIDSSGFTSSGATFEGHMQGFCEDESNWYMSFITADNAYTRIVAVNKETYNTTEHEFADLGHANSMCCIDNALYVVHGSTGATISKIDLATWIRTRITTPVQFGNIAFDRKTGEVYCRGTNAGGDYDIIYVVDGLQDGAPTVRRQITCVGTGRGVAQGIAAYDNIIYRCWSNPNLIIAYAAADGHIVQYLPPNPRLDFILPIGELEDMDILDGRLSICGINSALNSGASYITAIGSYDIGRGAPVVQSDDSSFPYQIYVNPSATRTYNEIGTSAAPFTTLWEAIESAIGTKLRTGYKSHIRINSGGNTFPYAIIPGDSVVGVASTGSYWNRINGITIRDGNTTLERLYIGTRTGQSGGACVHAVQCIATLVNCAFIYDENASGFNAVVETTQNASLNLQNLPTTPEAPFASLTLWTPDLAWSKSMAMYYTYSGTIAFARSGINASNFRFNDAGGGIVSPLVVGELTGANINVGQWNQLIPYAWHEWFLHRLYVLSIIDGNNETSFPVTFGASATRNLFDRSGNEFRVSITGGGVVRVTAMQAISSTAIMRLIAI